jgi:hypothetical protein
MCPFHCSSRPPVSDACGQPAIHFSWDIFLPSHEPATQHAWLAGPDTSGSVGYARPWRNNSINRCFFQCMLQLYGSRVPATRLGIWSLILIIFVTFVLDFCFSLHFLFLLHNFPSALLKIHDSPSCHSFIPCPVAVAATRSTLYGPPTLLLRFDVSPYKNFTPECPTPTLCILTTV